MRTFLTGATGFLGRRILRALSERGHEVRAISRDPSRVEALPGVEPVRADLLDLDALLPLFKGCDVGVHAAGTGALPSGQEMQAHNVQASRHVAAACRQARVGRLVAITSSAVVEAGDTPYRRVKIGQEAALRAYGLPLTVLRPTLVIGPWRESPGLTALVGRLRDRPRFVIPNGGRRRIQPVHVEDVASAAVAAVDREAAVGRFLMIAGTEDGIVYADFIREVRDRTGGRAAIRAMPLAPMRAAAAFASVIGGGTATRSQITYYSNDHLYPLAESRELLDYAPRSYDAALEDAFGPRPPGG